MDLQWVGDFVQAQGISTLLVLMLIVLLWKWAPQIIKAHINFVDTTAGTQETIANAAESMTENMRVLGHSHKNTNNALLHIIEAGRHASTCKDVHHHLDLARAKLDTPPNPLPR